MADFTAEYRGVQLLQTGLPNTDFTANDNDGIVFTPTRTGETVNALAYHTHHPLNSQNILWKSVYYTLTRQAFTTPQNFSLIVSLLGITPENREVLIGEDVITTCPTSSTTEKRGFDLLASACQPPLLKGSGTVAAGKIGLDLPKRWQYYSSITLNKEWYNPNWTRRRAIPIAGNSPNTLTNYQIQVTLAYSAAMKTDFSDIRFTGQDGVTILNHYLISKTDSSTATFWVKVPLIPATGAGLVNIFAYYGNSAANSSSDATNTFTDFDHFTSLSGWTVSGTTVSQSGTEVTLDSGTSPQIKRSFTKSGKFVVEVRYKHPSRFRNRLYVNNQTIDGSSSPLTVDYFIGDPSIYWGAWTGVNLALNTYYIIRWEIDPVAKTYVWRILTDNRASVIYQVAATNFTKTMNQIIIMGSESTSSDMVLDWYMIREYAPHSQEPTIGTVGSEENSTNNIITPATPTNEDTSLLYTPVSWVTQTPCHARYTEHGNNEYRTNNIYLNLTQIAKMGYNYLDGFNALRLRFNSTCTDSYAFKVSKIEYSGLI